MLHVYFFKSIVSNEICLFVNHMEHIFQIRLVSIMELSQIIPSNYNFSDLIRISVNFTHTVVEFYFCQKLIPNVMEISRNILYIHTSKRNFRWNQGNYVSNRPLILTWDHTLDPCINVKYILIVQDINLYVLKSNCANIYLLLEIN